MAHLANCQRSDESDRIWSADDFDPYFRPPPRKPMDGREMTSRLRDFFGL